MCVCWKHSIASGSALRKWLHGVTSALEDNNASSSRKDSAGAERRRFSSLHKRGECDAKMRGVLGRERQDFQDIEMLDGILVRSMKLSAEGNMVMARIFCKGSHYGVARRIVFQ